MKTISILIIIACLLPFFIFSINKDICKRPPYSEFVEKLMNRASKKIENKYNLKLIGTHKAVMDSVKELGFRFQLYGDLKKNEARKIVVDCVESFLADVNQDEKIKEYLEVYPFDAKNVEVIIFINPIDRGSYSHPHLSVISAFDGKIKFSTNDPNDEKRYFSRESETFEEAVKIVKGEIPPPPSEIK